jgi:hypothetical protein
MKFNSQTNQVEKDEIKIKNDQNRPESTLGNPPNLQPKSETRLTL